MCSAIDAAVVRRLFETKAAEGFSGAVLVEQGGRTILRSGYGPANDATHQPASPDIVFDLLSITKQFTAAAILQLEHDQRLSLGDSLREFFPEVPAAKAGITVHQLLTHTSGMASGHGQDAEVLTKEDALARIFAMPLVQAPGESYRYSNSGYTVLAAIVELLTGAPFLSYVESNLLRKAGLRTTADFSDPRFDEMSVASGYANGVDTGSPASRTGPTWSVMGAGEFLSTVDDMHRWLRALQRGTVIPLSQVAKLWTPYVNTGNSRGYGYGWRVRQSRLGTLVFHGGTGAGGNSIIALFPERDLAVVILGNRYHIEVKNGEGEIILPAERALDGLEEVIAADLVPTWQGVEERNYHCAP